MLGLFAGNVFREWLSPVATEWKLLRINNPKKKFVKILVLTLLSREITINDSVIKCDKVL